MPSPALPRRRAAVIAGALGIVVLIGLVLAARAFRATEAGASFIEQYPGAYATPEGTPDGFPAWLRWTHFLSAFFLLFIVSSGLHLRRGLRPPAFVTRRREGFLAAKNPARLGLHSWWHLVVDTLWVVTGLIYVVLLVASGHWARIVPTDLAVIPNAISGAVQYLSLSAPVSDSWYQYGSLQQLAYFVTVFVAAPLALITGLRLSPVWPERWMRARGPLSDSAARRAHGLVLWYFLTFTLVHVSLVLAIGARSNLNAMYAGVDDETSWLGVGLFALGTGVMAAAWVLLRPPAQIAIAARVADVRVMPAVQKPRA